MLNIFSPIETPIVNNQYRLHSVTQCNFYLPAAAFIEFIFYASQAGRWLGGSAIHQRRAHRDARAVHRLSCLRFRRGEAHEHPNRQVY